MNTTDEAEELRRTEPLPLNSVDEVRGPMLRRSLFLATLAWVFGAVWMSATAGAPITNFAKSLNASAFQFGVLSALPFLASLLSLPASLLIEATAQRKKIFLFALYFQRLMWIPIALIPWWMVRQYGEYAYGPAMFVFLAMIFLMHGGNAVGSPAWIGWMADLVPERARGRYFARRRQWGIPSAVLAAWIVGRLLDQHTSGNDPLVMLKWCALIFVGASVFGFLDIHLFHYVPEIPTEPKRGLHVFKAWREPLRNRRFVWFAGFVATLTFAVSFMGQFVTLYILEQVAAAAPGGRGNVNMSTQMMLIVAPSIAQLAVLSVWGRAIDRMGKRPILVIAGLGLVPVAVSWCFVTPGTIWLGYVLSMMGAMLWAGLEIANFNMVLEMSATGDEPGMTNGGTGYVAINSVIINIAGCLGGLSAGVIAQVLQNIHFVWVTPIKTFNFYDVLFLLSALLRLVSVVVFVPHMKEPEARPTREALRFMTANIYNNLYNAALQPLRFMGLRRNESYPARPTRSVSVSSRKL